MKKLTKVLLIGLCCGLLTVVLSFLTSTQAPALGTAPVTVVNTPLPVQGNVTSSVTGSVSVNNFPSTQPMSFNNSTTMPLLVRNIENPALQPFAFSLCAPINPAGPCPSASFTIPSTTSTGQPVARFVLEYVSGGCNLETGSVFNSIVVSTSLNGREGAYQFIPIVAGSEAGPEAPIVVYSIAQQLRGYADGGTDTNLFVLTTGPGFPQCSVNVSGYLVTR